MNNNQFIPPISHSTAHDAVASCGTGGEREVRDDALEDAAKQADKVAGNVADWGKNERRLAGEIARRIRNMKATPTTSVEREKAYLATIANRDLTIAQLEVRLREYEAKEDAELATPTPSGERDSIASAICSHHSAVRQEDKPCTHLLEEARQVCLAVIAVHQDSTDDYTAGIVLGAQMCESAIGSLKKEK